MKSIVLIASASALALGLAACGQKPVARAALDCPTSQDDLTLKSKAADGKTCVYSAEGSEVTLQLVSGDAETTLDRIETELLASRGSKTDDAARDAEEDLAAAHGDALKAEGKAIKAEARAAKAEAKAAKAGVSVNADVDSGVNVDVHGDGSVDGIEIDDNEGTARVNLPGIHIEADDKNDSARVRIGPIKIDANGDSATFRMRDEKRLRGEALSRERRGVRASFFSKVKDATDGYNFVGYEAAGPKVGPITVATIKAKSGDSGDDLRESLVKLVRRNGGV